MDLLALSIAPSVCGWNDVDIDNSVPIILCSSHHHFDMNLGSQSLMIEDGNPCICTISHTYIVDN